MLAVESSRCQSIDDKFTQADHDYMRQALMLAAKGKGMVSPNPLVGAIFVRNGKVLGEGFHTRVGNPHAEAEAVSAAKGDVKGSTLYVTLEPCNHQAAPRLAPRCLWKRESNV